MAKETVPGGRHAAGKKRKKGGVGRIVLIVLLLLAAAAAVCVYSVKKEIDGGNRTGVMADFHIEQGSGPATIANALESGGIIRYPRVFRYYVRAKGVAGKLQYGEFSLEMGASYDEIIGVLTKSVAAETVRLTFPEGTTALAMAQKIEEAGLCTADAFLDEANNGDFSEYAFWQYVPSDDEAPNRFMKCEGYLFPDTYDFYASGMSAHEIVATFYARFDAVMTDELYAEMDAQGLSLADTITLASFVQEEAGNAEDAKVSAVFRNRLAAGSPYPKLQSNASSYVQSDDDNNYLWNWVAPYYGGWDSIPENVKNAYDTYACTGLPAGPISNPGIDAIAAALNPDPDITVGAYYFFVTDNAGTYYYGRTADEHAANCDKAWAVNKTLK